MSRVRLFYIFITLALLVTASGTLFSAISIVDVTTRVRSLANGTPEKSSVAQQGQSSQANLPGGGIPFQTALIAIITVIIAFAIRWIVLSLFRSRSRIKFAELKQNLRRLARPISHRQLSNADDVKTPPNDTDDQKVSRGP